MGAPLSLLPRDGVITYHQAVFREPLADELLSALVRELPWEQHDARFFGRSVPLPRLTTWFGPLEYAYSGVVHPPRPMPPLVAEIRDAIAPWCGPADSVLANLYRSGRDSVAWHADDEVIWGPDPLIGSVSFGATRRFVLRHRELGERVAIDLEHGSLLVMAGRTQQCWLHAIPKTAATVGLRVNLTFRRIARPAELRGPRHV